MRLYKAEGKGGLQSSFYILAMGLFFVNGCTSYEVEQRQPNFLEKGGMGFVRTITSPINVLGPTYATYNHLYNESEVHVVKKVLVTPFVPLLTIPSGTFAMTTDVVTGPVEMLTFSHFSNVAYPWETYEYRVAHIWNEITPVLLVSLATAGAGAAAAADAMNGNGNSSATSYNSNYNAVPPYQESSNFNNGGSCKTPRTLRLTACVRGGLQDFFLARRVRRGTNGEGRATFDVFGRFRAGAAVPCLSRAGFRVQESGAGRVRRPS